MYLGKTQYDQIVFLLWFAFVVYELDLWSMQVISEIIETCRAHDFTDVILVYEHRGVPDKIVISHLPFGPTAYFQILNVVSDCALLLGPQSWA